MNAARIGAHVLFLVVLAGARAQGQSFTGFCFGDGAATSCPCSNVGGPGGGCDNSDGNFFGAWLVASGTTNPDTVVLTSHGLISGALSIVMQGDTLIPPVYLGDGMRCIGGVILRRMYVVHAIGAVATAPGPGDVSITQRSSDLGHPIPPGGTRHYQVYYRDPAPSFCPSPAGNSWNTSSGVTIVWQ